MTGYSTHTTPQDQPAMSYALDGILKRLEQVTLNLGDLHGIADRACGPAGPSELQPAMQPHLNGKLDEIEYALDILVGLSGSAVARLSRIA